MLGDTSEMPNFNSSTPPDADALWLYIVGGILLLILLVVAICFNSEGHPRRWLAKKLGMSSLD